ncbi:hypothetical protein PR003_g13936 [Phytophthora rubi]|uniref:Uncharacterized protein n=1 Tax=Phytophthora rubi TaxID=129364 RepID=A0A6A4F424_9STRA|nr:hypothetical protein PR003_g13936 [Phytophthora rubi]
MPTASILAEKVLGYIFTLPLLGANVWCRGVAWCAAGCVVRCGLRGALRAAGCGRRWRPGQNSENRECR